MFLIEDFRRDVTKAREELGITIGQLAKDAGCSPISIRTLEAGKAKRLSQKTCERLCDALGLDSSVYLDVIKEPAKEPEAEKEEEPAAEEPEAEAPQAEAEPAPEPDKPAPKPKKKPRPKWGVMAADSKPDFKWDRLDPPPTLEEQLEDLKRENKELKKILDIKNCSIQEEHRRADGLQSQLDEDDRLILDVLKFLQRLREGDVRLHA